jgi:hypothetical protein
MKKSALSMCLLLLLSSAAGADDAVTPGELIVEPPTLICLGFQWQATGDENRNATVAVE